MSLSNIVLLAVAAVMGVATPAQAGSSTTAYAIVVGSNPGGPGQATLKYAERDARNVATLLADIGGYQRANIKLLTRPTPSALLAAVDELAARIRRDARAGKQSRVLFYYSGHARSKSLNLGTRELALDALRARIVALPATLRVVILDACQSGAFSGVKGVSPAADFSFNSVSRLNATGVAVMASSSATELSQESPRLRGSYFTHYLLVALRGAGDRNRDGKVSIDEAYKYAYDRTLVATAKTAVGRQHVTLETDLKGKGDVPLSYPARADSQLELPASLRGEVLITHRRGGAVVAEVYKARGALRVALATGSYRALVRTGKRLRQCDLSLQPGRVTVLRIERCQEAALEQNATKGGLALRKRWSLETGFGLGFYQSDRFTERLGDFGYDNGTGFGGHYSISVGYRLNGYLDVIGNFSRLAGDEFERRGDTELEAFRFTTYGMAAMLRASYGSEGAALYAQAGAGMARASTALRIGAMDPTREKHWGWQLAAAAGAHLTPWSRLGFFAQTSWVHAPVIDNLLGDTHDSGGLYVAIGARTRF